MMAVITPEPRIGKTAGGSMKSAKVVTVLTPKRRPKLHKRKPAMMQGLINR